MRAMPGKEHISSERLIYAVGDIHGRADLLARLLPALKADLRARHSPSAARPLLVFLGDYVDKGPHSRQVIDLLLALAEDSLFESRFLLGNHEETLLDFLAGRIRGRTWAEHGGDATLQSYGVAVDREADWADARDRLREAVPTSHVRFLESLELMIEAGQLLFVHAGIRPGLPLDQQTTRDLLWIRSEFLKAPVTGEHLIVHGHTPQDGVYAAPGRLCLDSAAYMSGRLSAAVFGAEGVEVIDSVSLTARPFPVRGPLSAQTA